MLLSSDMARNIAMMEEPEASSISTVLLNVYWISLCGLSAGYVA